mmetsp:Transcript_27261/g.37924  ORF Transcript_27261/g.37924 Transcript_27261/m.37924 type:complete len:229 (-) Transcript_27261:245-931(-)
MDFIQLLVTTLSKAREDRHWRLCRRFILDSYICDFSAFEFYCHIHHGGTSPCEESRQVQAFFESLVEVHFFVGDNSFILCLFAHHPYGTCFVFVVLGNLFFRLRNLRGDVFRETVRHCLVFLGFFFLSRTLFLLLLLCFHATRLLLWVILSVTTAIFFRTFWDGITFGFFDFVKKSRFVVCHFIMYLSQVELIGKLKVLLSRFNSEKERPEVLLSGYVVTALFGFWRN